MFHVNPMILEMKRSPSPLVVQADSVPDKYSRDDKSLWGGGGGYTQI